MAPSRVPPLLSKMAQAAAADASCERELREMFDYLYVGGHWYVYPGRGHDYLRVVFEPRDFDHVCYKEADASTPERTVWRPARAERLLWIGHTIENPWQTRWLRDERRYILLTRTGDPALPVYQVVLDLVHDHFDFITAYPGDRSHEKKLHCEGVLVPSKPY